MKQEKFKVGDIVKIADKWAFGQKGVGKIVIILKEGEAFKFANFMGGGYCPFLNKFLTRYNEELFEKI